MSKVLPFGRLAGAAAVCVALGAVAAKPLQATLVIGLEPVSGPHIVAGVIDPKGPGEVYVFDVYAYVIGGRDPSRPEGFLSVTGSFVAPVPPSGVPSSRFSPVGDTPAIAPFNAYGSSVGVQQPSGTLGEDGNSDVRGGRVVFRASSMQFDAAFHSTLGPVFHIGRVEWEILGPDFPIMIRFEPWRGSDGQYHPWAATWMEDGVIKTAETGEIACPTVPFFLPEPSGMLAMTMAAGLLLRRWRG